MRLSVPVSVLDRANARIDEDATATLRGVIERARRLEAGGIRRLWVAEHHAVPGIAGSAPALLMAAIAEATRSIRVGAGGFMVPSRPPIVTAEHVTTLEALHPGRIDVGLGNALGFTDGVRRALGQRIGDRGRFADDVGAIVDYLEGRGPVTVQPQPVRPTPLFVLTGGTRAGLAAEHGMGLVLGGPAGALRSMADAVAAYHAAFSPSPALGAAHVILSVQAVVADTAEEARSHALPEVWSLVRSRTTGSFVPLRPAEELDESSLSDRERGRIETGLTGVVYGTAASVAQRLQRMAETVDADELMVTNAIWSREGREQTDAALAAMSA